ncbi:MAG: helix-turn-helix transcriptional regulator [Polyangiaceae bacterium]|nr:helix-turn-helix transcriptional regulator [Polyangiaceae bacterium]
MKTDDRGPALVAIGGRIKQRRRELRITQEALAEKAGLSKSFVSEIEGGQASAAGLMYLKLAKALEVSVEWLLTGETPERPIVRPSDVEIPAFVADVAEEQGWSYGDTLDVAAALETYVARRTRGRRVQPGRDELIALAEALRRLQPTTHTHETRKKR